MGDLAKRDPVSSKDSIQKLLSEIAILEENIGIVGSEISSFETTIRQKLNVLISRLISLNEKMKEKQQLKKAKRLEQKKRGKNYKEPVQLISTKGSKSVLSVSENEEKQELKRLYKEAIVKVHPDKIDHASQQDEILRAHELTTQLNGIYKNGDLEQLLSFYQINILGNQSELSNKTDLPLIDTKIRLTSLRTKKENLALKLQQLQANYLYHVLQTYEKPEVFIEELEAQFQEKIGKLEKRTRKF
jgi:hypothetical protein